MNKISWIKRQHKFLLLALILMMAMVGCVQAASGDSNNNNDNDNDDSGLAQKTSSPAQSVKLSSRAGNVLFNPPKGWQRLDQNGGGVLFIPAKASADNPPCTIGIFPGEDFRGDFKEAFNQLLARGKGGAKVLVEPQITEIRDDDDAYSILLAQTVLQDNDGQLSYRFYVAAHPENRLEIFAFFAESESVYKEYYPVFVDFANRIDFVSYLEAKNSKPKSNGNVAPNRSNSGNAPSNRATVGKGLSGFYVGTDSHTEFNFSTHYYDYIIRHPRYLFLPDGRVYYGMPTGGSLDNFNFAQLQQQDPKDCGRYQLSGGKIQFQFGTDAPYTQDFAQTSDSVTLGNIKLYRVDKFDNFQLQGLYGQGTYVASAGVSGDHKIAFTKDGRFQKSDFVGVVVTGSQANAATSESRAGEGTYQIKGNTLELRYRDGRQEKLTFYVYPENVGENPPGLIVIDGGSYLLRK